MGWDTTTFHLSVTGSHVAQAGSAQTLLPSDGCWRAYGRLRAAGLGLGPSGQKPPSQSAGGSRRCPGKRELKTGGCNDEKEKMGRDTLGALITRCSSSASIPCQGQLIFISLLCQVARLQPAWQKSGC